MLAFDSEDRSVRKRTERTLLAVAIGVAVLVAAASATIAIHVVSTKASGHSLLLYDGILVNVRNDTGKDVQLDCEYTHSPRLSSGQTALASFEPGQQDAGCGVVRVSDRKRLGCLVLNTKASNKADVSTIRISTHLNRSTECYGE
jgi:hypothetical protein